MELSSLSGSDLSLDRMKVYFSSATNLIGKNASKSNFLKRFYSYKIIQIYSHASQTSVFSEPVIYFADSALYLSELIGEHKPLTNLVILSACETGIGKLQQGEGVFGFNRGFAALGIPSTITNLWSVDNRANYRLTELFYKYVSQNLPLDIALQKSKIDLLEGDIKLPYFWAASALSGKTNVIQLREEMPKKSKVILIIILVLLIVGITVLVKNKKDNKSLAV
jgi:CHAT domain-containing protein